MTARTFSIIVLAAALTACAGQPQKTATKAPPPAVDVTQLVAAGDATREDGRFSEAMRIYEQALVANPGTVAAQYGMAESLLALQRPRDAKPMFERLTADGQWHAAALQGAGLAELSLRHTDAAAKELQQAVAADAGLWRAYNGLALLADLARRPSEAEAFYAKAMAIKPESAVLFNNRGFSRLSDGKPREAAADFRRALQIEPGSETVQNNLRLAVAALGDYAEATRNLPRDRAPSVLNNVGYVAMRRGDLAAAEALLARAIAENPNYDAVAAGNVDRLNALKGGAK